MLKEPWFDVPGRADDGVTTTTKRLQRLFSEVTTIMVSSNHDSGI